MARIQILELPEEEVGDVCATPFILVVDQWPDTVMANEPAVLAAWKKMAEEAGARTVLLTEDTIDIPANDVPVDPDGYPLKIRVEGEFEQFREQVQQEVHSAMGKVTRALRETGPVHGRADIRDATAALREERDDARNWARHGYEIGQRHCGWTDHGVAPAWLTEGWPPHIDSCEHLQQAAEFDTALTRVRNLPEQPEAMDAQHPDPAGYLHGYGVAIREAKRTTYPPQLAESGDTERSPEEY